MVHARSKNSKDRKKAKMKIKKKEKLQIHAEIKERFNANIVHDLSVVLHQNEILKSAIKKRITSKRTQTLTSHRFCTPFGKTVDISKTQNRHNAKNELCNMLPSMPVILSKDNITVISKTDLKGTFGEISLISLKNIPGIVAVQKEILMKKARKIEILAEAKVMHLLSGHVLFPYCFGFVQPNIIISQFIGELMDGNNITTSTVYKMMVKECICKYRWTVICYEIIEGITFLHGLGILHNDIKADNVLLYGPMNNVKLIDFGKCTLTSSPVTYNLSAAESAMYNQKHRYLANELRNVMNSKQTELTDIYSVGYMIKHVAYFQKFNFLYEIGRKMKTIVITERMRLEQAKISLKSLLSNFSF